MKGVNLIPKPLRIARSRKRRARRWALACAAYATALLMCCVVMHGLWSSRCLTLNGDISSTSRRIDEANRNIATLRAQLSSMQENSRTSQAIADQPDWGLLLAAISAETDDDMVLREIRLGAAASVGGRTVADEPWAPRRYVISIRGVSHTSAGVSKFVSKLEQMQFFTDVKLLRTTRETVLNSPASGFEMECTFGETRRVK